MMSSRLVFLLLGLVLAFQLASCAPHPDEDDLVESEADDEISELALVPSDDDETAYLGEYPLFSDYCIKSRDHIMKTMKDSTNQAFARAFELLFKSADDVAVDVVKTLRDATGTLGNQLENPDTEIAEKEPQSEAERIIYEEQKKVKGLNNAPKSLLGAFMAALKATGSAIVTALSQRIADQRENINWTAFFGTLSGACDEIGKLEVSVKERFEKALAEIVAQDPKYRGRTFGQTQCVTASRISRLEGMCGMVRFTSGPMLSLIEAQRQVVAK